VGSGTSLSALTNFFLQIQVDSPCKREREISDTFPRRQRGLMERLLLHPLIPDIILLMAKEKVLTNNSSIASQILQPGFLTQARTGCYE